MGVSGIQNIQAIDRVIRKEFAAAIADLKESEPLVDEACLTVPSVSSGNDYAWLGDVPELERWVGELPRRNLQAFTYRVDNELFGVRIAIPRTHFEDDNTGLVGLRVKQLIEAAGELKEKLLAEFINNAFTRRCFDGQDFIDTDHPLYDANNSVFSNKATSALAETPLRDGIRVMMDRKNDQGKPIGAKPTVLVVPPGLMWTAKELVEKERLASGTDNILRNIVRVVVLRRLTSATAWFLLDTSRAAAKPFIWQQRMAPELVSMIEANDHNVVERDEYVWQVR